MWVRSPRLLETREAVLGALRGLAKELNATVYLFGGYARGDHMVDSDVDVVVVSEVFRSMGYAERVELVRLKLPPDFSFDIIPLTPDELAERLKRGFFREISRYWVQIRPD